MTQIIACIKRIFCRHDWEICRDVGERFVCISGEQLYKRCRKCGKAKKWIYREYEGMGYK